MLNASYINFFQSFLRDRTSRLVFCISFILLLLIYFSFFRKSDLKFFPSNKSIHVEFYNDSAVGGNSIIEKQIHSDSLICMTFVLRKGFVRPFVGINIFNEKKQDIDISAFNEIQIETEGIAIKDIVVNLITSTKNKSIIYKNYKDLFFCHNIEVASKKQQFNLNLNNFKVPDLWYDGNNLSPNLNLTPDLKHLTRINIGTGLTPDVDIKRVLKIHSITFVRNNIWVLIYTGLIQLGILFLLIVIFFAKSKLNKKNSSITIKYKPVFVGEKPELQHNFLDYIHENFHDCELSLDKISRNTDTNQRVISDTIAEKFNCNFKTYINQIRINEAKRLLRETKLNSREIAYKVGFSTPSHFNRVFKTLTGYSPSEYLKDIG